MRTNFFRALCPLSGQLCCFSLGFIPGLLLLLWNSQPHVHIQVHEKKCCLSLQRSLQWKGDTKLYILFSYFVLQLWFSSCRAPSPLTFIYNPIIKQNITSTNLLVFFQELYYACKFDLDGVTILIGYSVIQEVTVYGSVCPCEPSLSPQSH